MKQSILYQGFGFPVLLKGVMYKGEGPDRYLDVPHEAIARSLLHALLCKKAPWTGAELRFVRKELDLTQAEFARLMHVKTSSNVVFWEKKELLPTGLSEPAEFFIRLQVVREVFGEERMQEFFSLFHLTELNEATSEPVEIDLERAA